MPLILLDEEQHLLGMTEMDLTHLDFIEQVNALEKMKGSELCQSFSELLQHTIDHFQREDALMEDCRFPQIAEHRVEHRKVVAEMERFSDQLRQGKSMFARAYIRERLPDWFNLHLKTMDSALVWHLEQTNAKSCREHQYSSGE